MVLLVRYVVRVAPVYKMIRRISGSSASRIRNIGIVAHIDAGKTTVTESILYKSGSIMAAGHIKDGSTTTDFLQCEQDRGITVAAASVQALWKDHTINIIDTPGHIEFNAEVERSLRVLDGALVILDGTRGVEPQTMTVWRQLQKFRIPRMIFLNKFDRGGRDLDMCLNSIRDHFEVEPILLTIPRSSGTHTEQKNSFEGVKSTLQSESSRMDIMETLALFSETLESEFLGTGLSTASAERVLGDVKHVMGRTDTIVPVAVGSGLTGVGIAECLDLITQLFPSPLQVLRKLPSLLRHELVAVVFKSTYDKVRGVVNQCRVYSGTVRSGSKIYCVRSREVYLVGKILRPMADTFETIREAHIGDIVILTGCKGLATGDVILDPSWVEKHLDSYQAMINDNRVLNSPLNFTLPLFFCKVTTPTTEEEKRLEHALAKMSIEDPTLSVRKGKDQDVIVGGSGQLHLNIIRERLQQEHFVDCNLREIRVRYCEAVLSDFTVPIESTEDGVFGSVTFSSLDEAERGSVVVLSKLRKDMFDVVCKFLRSFYTLGPLLGLPMMANTQITCSFDSTPRDIPLDRFARIVKMGVKSGLKANEALITLAEPYARVMVTGPINVGDAIISDFVSRLQSPDYSATYDEKSHSPTFCFRGVAPLALLADYSSVVQRITNGSAMLHYIKPAKYRALPPLRHQTLLREVREGATWLP